MNRRGFFRGLGAAALAAPIAAWSAGAPRREGVHLEGATIYGPLTLCSPGPVTLTNCTITAASGASGSYGLIFETLNVS